jgi:hypothetical protein
MSGRLDEVSCASLPPGSLSGLAGLRTRSGVRAREENGRLWLWWQAGDGEVVSRVLPLSGVALYSRRDGAWFRHGCRLPSSDVPGEDGAPPLVAVLTPAPVTPLQVEFAAGTVRLAVVRDGRPRPAAALLCELADLARWADTATSRHLGALRAARCGDRVLVLGKRLPPLSAGERWWGDGVLVPLGFRPEPNLPEGVLRQALGLEDGDAALLGVDGAERVPAEAFGPMSRAGVRLAVGHS